ncbi:uncharacterized protein LOC112539502 [Tetranychus urticae]|uniref:Uncharacterized protein n=1 Tax=Tetranychus urticae TaxID=32264 RepID=T1KXB3_TETUR|nr:uncharacterized protein LOC112539502 [Tetranychus urticae]
MDGNNCNSDKITIKVKIPGEDYHVISIDWSNESLDFRRQIFQQLAVYTGIPVEYSEIIWVNRHPMRSITIKNRQFNEVYIDDRLPDEDSQENLMNYFHDGDFFMLNTYLIPGDNGLYNVYIITNINLIDETGFTHYNCPYLASRAINDRIAKLIKSHYIQSNMEGWVRRGEFERIQLDLNFKQYFLLNCSEWPGENIPFELPYLRNRG